MIEKEKLWKEIINEQKKISEYENYSDRKNSNNKLKIIIEIELREIKIEMERQSVKENDKIIKTINVDSTSSLDRTQPLVIIIIHKMTVRRTLPFLMKHQIRLSFQHQILV